MLRLLWGKNDMFSSDLIQSLINTSYSFFSHNYTVLVYLFGSLLSAVLCLIKPSRFHLFLFFGFLILSFTYEYDKHLIEPLRNQTLESLLGSVESQAHPKVNKVVELVVSELIPVCLYVLGWGMIFVGIVIREPEANPSADGQKQKLHPTTFS